MCLIHSVLILALCTQTASDSMSEAQEGLLLDQRIDPTRITLMELPPLPEKLVQPLPPEHRIAPSFTQNDLEPTLDQQARAAITKGLEALRAIQSTDGLWGVGQEANPTGAPRQKTPVDLAITALVVKAFAQAGQGDDTAAIRGINALLAARQTDGTYGAGPLTNYVTASIVSALAAQDEFEYGGVILDTTTQLKQMQWDEAEGLTKSQDWYGGSGYGNRGRPDLSNTQMMLEALYDAGVSPDEPAVQRALAFVSRAQNLRATNDSSWNTNDGGFIYTPANGGESMASEAAGEGRDGRALLAANESPSLRSYGSMSYAGFKSLLYAGLTADDVRVRAVYDWIRNNWTLDENPGLGQQGYYYYLHALARALRVAQQNNVIDASGVVHDWRVELITALVSRQQANGQWINLQDRWLENEPALTTAYALLALEEALKPFNKSNSKSTEPVQ